MQLNYLIFDASDDGEGTGTWEAVASVRDNGLSALRVEVQCVVAFAQAHEPGPRGPLDEGGAWDADEHISRNGEWTTFALTLTGPWAWGEALITQLSGA